MWLPGTNYNVGWKNGSGTSVSAAVYAAFLAESLSKYNNDNLLNDLMENYQTEMFKELNHEL